MLAVSPIDEIAKVNKYKSDAELAFKTNNYEQAANLYSYLADSMNVREAEVLLNLGHCYFKTEELDKAKQLYNEASVQADKHIRSVANQQLGVLSSRDQKIEEALTYFKEALKADPTNEEARFNYELLKKQKEEEDKKKEENKKDEQNEDKKEEEKKDEQKQDQQNENQDNQEQKDEQSQDEQSKEQEQKEQEQKKEEQQKQEQKEQQQSEEQKKKEQEEMQNQRLDEIKMSKEKAEMILNALKNQEIQYYQQKQKKSDKKKDNSKPDW